MIPKKIKPYFKTIIQKTDGDNTLIDGILTCCNTHEFEVYFTGEIKHRLFSKMCLYPKDDKIMLAVRCKKCGNVITVFDSSCDGYEHCGNKHHTCSCSIPKPLACKKCSDNHFSVSIRYEYPDIEELNELGIIETDCAFTWIFISLKCNTCGKKYNNFVDFETS